MKLLVNLEQHNLTINKIRWWTNYMNWKVESFKYNKKLLGVSLSSFSVSQVLILWNYNQWIIWWFLTNHWWSIDIVILIIDWLTEWTLKWKSKTKIKQLCSWWLFYWLLFVKFTKSLSVSLSGEKYENYK